MKKTAVLSENAPSPIGPYSQAIEVEPRRMVFLSGQIPLDPKTGQLVAGTIEEETIQVLENLKAVLAAAGMGLSHVVRTGIFLTDLGDFQEVNRVYARYFPDTPPARSTVQVGALPKGARVEIDAIAAAV